MNGVGAYLDLVNLATASSDATGNLKIAEQRLQRLEQLQGNVVSNNERATAKVEAENARRKVTLLMEIAKAALEAAAAEVESATASYKSGVGTASDLRAAQSKEAILRIILKGGE